MECFTVFADGIEGRLDPFYYSKIFLENEKVIKSSKWDVKSLKKISNRIVDGPFGSQLKVEEYANEGIPLIRVKDVKNEELQEDDFVFITKEKQEQLKRSKVNPKDVILTKAGSIGNACVFPTHLQEANITSHLAKIEIKEGINPYYICKYLNTKFGRLQIFREGNKTTRPELNISEVSSILIPIPPSSIQNHIVAIMDKAYTSKKSKEVDAQQLLNSIDDYVLSELGITQPPDEKKMCYSIYSDEIEGRFDPHFYKPEFRILEENLSKVDHKDLCSVIEFSNETWNQKDFFENEFPYIEISKIDITSGDLQNIIYYEKSKAPSRAKRIVRENDIIVSTTRPHRGAITPIDKDKDGFIASTGFAILREPKIKINKKYLLFFLRTQLALKQMLQRSSGGNYPAIASEELKKVIVPLPPLSIQYKIADEVKRRMQKAEQLKKEAKEVLEEAKERVERIILGEEET